MLVRLWKNAHRQLRSSKPQPRRQGLPWRFRPRLETLEDRLAPAIITVTTASDTLVGNGQASLREAILSINAGADVNSDVTAHRVGVYGKSDTIAFSIAGPTTINVGATGLGSLPTVIKPVSIDGTTQPGFNPLTCKPLIVLNGISAGSLANGLVLSGGNSIVKGMVIDYFNGSGIVLQTNGSDTLQDNYIGVDATGSNAAGNAQAGVVVLSPNNMIGGALPCTGNVISGNANGIYLAGATGNQVQGNIIGPDASGTKALGNFNGLFVTAGANNNTIGGAVAGAGNVISSNGNAGIFLQSVSGTQVQGNYIGTDISGTRSLGNGLAGMYLLTSAGNSIGGTSGGGRDQPWCG
jgi:CSLREA domain-containing protein